MNYSICLLDSAGRTQHSQFTPFPNDEDAIQRAQTQLPAAAIVKVRKENVLPARFFREAAEARL